MLMGPIPRLDAKRFDPASREIEFCLSYGSVYRVGAEHPQCFSGSFARADPDRVGFSSLGSENGFAGR